MRKVSVDPENKHSDHYISLTDGKITIGLVIIDAGGHIRDKGMSRNPTVRTAMKTRTGEMKWDSFNDPWSPVAQETLVGGRANLDHEKDNSKFWDSFRANTQYGYFSSGSLEKYSTGIRLGDMDMPGSVTFLPIKPGANLYFASKRSHSATYTAANLYIIAKRKGTPADLTVQIRSDNGGVPGTPIKTMTLTTADITDVVSQLYKLTIPSNYSATLNAAFWLECHTTTADEKNYWAIGVYPKASSTAKCSTDGTTWITSDYELYYRMTPADNADVQCKMFQYHYSEFAFISINSAPSKLYVNGDHGQADSNTGNLSQLVDASKAWPVDKHKGKVVKIVKGPGSTEWQNWRVISSNAAGYLAVSPPWKITHTQDTEYAILGSDDWYELTGITLTDPVDFDPLVVNDIVYIPQGDTNPIMRMYWKKTLNTNNGGFEFLADSTNKATCLQQVRDATNGLEIWRGQNSDANGDISLSKSPLKDYGTGTTYLAFGAEIPLKDERGRITNIVEYGDTTKVPWVMREGSIYQIVSNKPDEIPLREISTMMDTNNGRAALVHDVYLYFNYGQGIERYYDKELADVGPNRDLGFPTGRKGYISCMVGYPARFFASVDAGEGISSVNVTNLTGWHEVYRAPAAGQRIRAMAFQTIPGTTPDRLWVQVGNDIISINFPSGGLDPLVDENMQYTWESTIEYSRFYVGMYDVQKFFRSFKIWADNLSAGQNIELDYRVNEDTEWSTCDGAFTDETKELFPVAGYGTNGVCIQPRLRILTNDCSKTVRGKALVINNISRVPIKYNYGIPYRLRNYDRDANGHEDDMAAEEKQLIIDDWATSLTPLVMRCKFQQFDNKVVFIDPIPLDPLASYEEDYLAKLTLVEI